MNEAVSFIYELERYGLTDVILPFLLIFTLVYAVLTKTPVLGKKYKQGNVVVALIVALTTVVPHVTGRYPAGMDVVNIINAALPEIALFMVIGMMLLVMLGVFGVETKKWFGPIIGLVSVVFLIYIFGVSAQLWYDFAHFYDVVTDLWAIRVALIVIAVVIGLKMITGSEESSTGNNFGKFIQDLFGKGK